ncbi:MAG: DUF1700 domain-containing protein [Lachnospiraceae bacterium]|nr:DUF1700 domain-containing protein [Lachnospiraceae bacterium]
MTRQEYMHRLALALADVPQSEKDEALQYYNDYFDDAGAENEQEVMRSLGAPEKLAESIRAEFFSGKSGQEHTTYQDSYAETTGDSEKSNKLSSGMIALIVVLAILASPLLIAVAATLFGIIVSILAVLFSIGVTVFALIVVMVCLVIACILLAIPLASVSPFGTIIVAGVGLMSAGICIFLVMAVVWLFGTAIPWLIRGCINLVKRLFSKKGGRK